MRIGEFNVCRDSECFVLGFVIMKGVNEMRRIFLEFILRSVMCVEICVNGEENLGL